jgi:chromosome segregation protein
VKITQLELAGFRGVRDKVSIEFPSGFAIITGANGTGKSTICDAIEYALSGSILRHPESKETGETFEDYLWWRGHGHVESRFVTLTLLSEDNQEITIKRDPTGLHGIDETTIGNALCGEDSADESIAHNLCQTSIIRGEHVAELSLDLAETERFNFVKRSLGASDLSHVEEKASEVSKWFRDEASRLDADYTRIRNLILQITTEISAATAQLSETEDLAAAESGLRSLLGNGAIDSTTLMSRARAELGSLHARIPSLLATTQRIKDAEAAIRESETSAYETSVKQIDQQLAAFRQKRDTIEKETRELEEKLRQEQEKRPALESWAQLCEHGRRLGLQNGKCPLCASAVTDADFGKQLEKIHDDIEGQNAALLTLVGRQTKLRSDLQSSTLEMESLQRQHQDLVARPESLKRDLVRLKEECSRLVADIPAVNRDPEEAVNEMRQRATSLEKYVGLLETSKTVERVNQLRKQLEEHRKQGDQIDAKISKQKILSERFREAAAAIKRMSGELVDDRLAQLSPLLQEIYARLRPHVDWTEMSYLIRGDVRRFLSLRVGNELNPKFMFSSGQRRAAGLAFLLAVHLSRSRCRLNSLVLDDPVQHIDDYRALHLVEILHAIRRSGRQVICTIEDESLASLLCRRLRGPLGEEGVLLKMGYVPNAGVVVKGSERFVPSEKISILAA